MHQLSYIHGVEALLHHLGASRAANGLLAQMRAQTYVLLAVEVDCAVGQHAEVLISVHEARLRPRTITSKSPIRLK
jgi:hypothetical protein